LNDVFGSALPHAWHFSQASAISADGRWLVGTIWHSREMSKGFILDTGQP
jgi:hypothetical protein